MHDNYDEFGRIRGTRTDRIERGDLVEYRDAKTAYVNGRRQRTFIILSGTWDGEKVQFDDAERTVVRAKEWLTLKAKHLRNVIGQHAK